MGAKFASYEEFKKAGTRYSSEENFDTVYDNVLELAGGVFDVKEIYATDSEDKDAIFYFAKIAITRADKVDPAFTVEGTEYHLYLLTTLDFDITDVETVPPSVEAIAILHGNGEIESFDIFVFSPHEEY